MREWRKGCRSRKEREREGRAEEVDGGKRRKGNNEIMKGDK